MNIQSEHMSVSQVSGLHSFCVELMMVAKLCSTHWYHLGQQMFQQYDLLKSSDWQGVPINKASSPHI